MLLSGCYVLAVSVHVLLAHSCLYQVAGVAGEDWRTGKSMGQAGLTPARGPPAVAKDGAAQPHPTR